jgi:hypothetical protein
MGLDMYAFWTEGSDEENQKIHNEGGEVATNELAYWRKVRQVHNFMEDIYKERGGTDTFNCIPLELTKNNLEALAAAMDCNELREDTGFFFGDWNMDEESKEYTHKFIKEAIKLIDEGKHVFYDSWW